MSLSISTETCKSKPPTAPTTALTTTPTPPQDEKRCAYSSKTCMNSRAVKQNKTLHKLCEFHRRKANLNQLRMQQRRRLQRRQSLDRGGDGTQGPAIKETGNIVALDDEFGAPLVFQDHEFSPEELKVLEIMLFDSDESESDFDQGFRRNNARFSC